MQYIQSHKYITLHHTVTSPAYTKADLPTLAKSMEAFHKTKSWAEDYKTGGEFGYSYLSYHYLFALDGSYIQIHDTKYMRIHATDSARRVNSHNLHGIAIAVVGNLDNTVPSQALINGIAALCAELEKKYKISFAIRGHKETAVYVNSAGTVFYPEKTGVFYTSCPGAYMGTSNSGVVKQIIDKTNELLTTKPWYETVTQKVVQLTNDKVAYLYNIDTGEKIKEYPAKSVVGTDYILGDYYITNYSVVNKTKNGFKNGEWKEYVPGDNLEDCKKEVERLNAELSALNKSYVLLLTNLEEKNTQLDDLSMEKVTLKKDLETANLEVSQKGIIIDRQEADIKWLEEQIEILKREKKKLQEDLAGCSSLAIESLTWAEIFSGILAKFKRG